MPYKNTGDLPKSVKDALPEKARKIYVSAYNNAWDQYRDSSDRKGDDSREDVSHKVAWAAVKKKFEKDGDEWKEK